MLIDKPQCNFKNCRYCFDGNCRSADKYENCKLTDLHYEIAKLTVDLDNANGEWISVEKPPETYRDESGELIPFLVCCKGTVYPFRAVYDGTTWGDGIGRLKVTHWMPLPEPPKGE